MIRNIEFIRRWAEALESGSYKQGIYALRDIKDNYCCMGVACDLIDNTKWSLNNIGGYTYSAHLTAMVSDEIQNKIGINSTEQYELVKLNDKGVSFKNIAQFIREKFLKEKVAKS